MTDPYGRETRPRVQLHRRRFETAAAVRTTAKYESELAAYSLRATSIPVGFVLDGVQIGDAQQLESLPSHRLFRRRHPFTGCGLKHHHASRPQRLPEHGRPLVVIQPEIAVGTHDQIPLLLAELKRIVERFLGLDLHLGQIRRRLRPLQRVRSHVVASHIPPQRREEDRVPPAPASSTARFPAITAREHRGRLRSLTRHSSRPVPSPSTPDVMRQPARTAVQPPDHSRPSRPSPSRTGPASGSSGAVEEPSTTPPTVQTAPRSRRRPIPPSVHTARVRRAVKQFPVSLGRV